MGQLLSGKIYIIVASGGEYEDEWNRNLFATTDKDKADSKVLELIADKKVYRETIEKLNVLRNSIHEEFGPIPYEQIDLPQMKNERTKINLLNAQSKRRYNEARAARDVIITAREADLLASLGYASDDPIYQHCNRSESDVNYEVEEVNEI